MATKRKRKKKTKWVSRFIPQVGNLYLRWVLRIVIAFFVVTIVWVMLLSFINPPITWLMIQRGFERKSDGEAWKITKQWVPYEDLSDNLKRAAIAGEDARFLTHWGFDSEAIADAYQRNKDGGRLRGGSTISQQTAKNVFLWPNRSWIRKGFETYFTLLIELFWSKKRILEVYLNVIETGDGLYGVEAATQHYFGKSAKSLTKRQAALLIAVLPNPRRWSPAKPTAFINRKAGTIVRYMGYSEVP
ncbi:monofunctional biosynthetic peptidoglycan transglycosylase [Parapedobacter indicus]|uniref:Biosynthetic peptidoglycan transglycosylase n=1 Tax=Parapedobacter indicus TaxID=1477437 RepID=A0A1I3FKJ1_9SPHI|nr:monofunctional biosynthetic peptidoglycan transglycosylase [Parapedobacter indicus]PPL03767.1 monofunctional biosynthetic peptidoglycan transglycosylase [Parapedobacter indicus]SFI11704.1 monofunctional biosynthetic peptidoglycan transglycosylase [Parapedobacter indicus]